MPPKQVILGIESSCDDTAAAVIVDGMLKSSVVSSQLEHVAYGGVVPELASRAHERVIVPVVEEALRQAQILKSDLSGIAVTSGPGLIGSLLVGVSFTKAMAVGLGVPFIGINHLEGHLSSLYLGPKRSSLAPSQLDCIGRTHSTHESDQSRYCGVNGPNSR